MRVRPSVGAIATLEPLAGSRKDRRRKGGAVAALKQIAERRNRLEA